MVGIVLTSQQFAAGIATTELAKTFLITGCRPKYVNVLATSGTIGEFKTDSPTRTSRRCGTLKIKPLIDISAIISNVYPQRNHIHIRGQGVGGDYGERLSITHHFAGGHQNRTGGGARWYGRDKLITVFHCDRHGLYTIERHSQLVIRVVKASPGDCDKATGSARRW